MKTTNKILVFFLLITSQFIFADAPGFDDDVNDVPIDDWVIPVAIMGAMVMFYWLRKRISKV